MALRDINIDSYAEADRWREAQREDSRLRGPWRPEYVGHTYRQIIECAPAISPLRGAEWLGSVETREG